MFRIDFINGGFTPSQKSEIYNYIRDYKLTFSNIECMIELLKLKDKYIDLSLDYLKIHTDRFNMLHFWFGEHKRTSQYSTGDFCEITPEIKKILKITTEAYINTSNIIDKELLSVIDNNLVHLHEITNSTIIRCSNF